MASKLLSMVTYSSVHGTFLPGKKTIDRLVVYTSAVDAAIHVCPPNVRKATGIQLKYAMIIDTSSRSAQKLQTLIRGNV